MQNRIKQIIENENLSYSKFADMIDIQRSSISHIVNGRNKASLEVIQKILETFDYIEPNWLLFGRGSLIKAETKAEEKNLFSDITVEDTKNKELTKIKEEENSISVEKMDNNTENLKIEHSTEVNKTKKKVERVIIFYTDKSFSEYSPE